MKYSVFCIYSVCIQANEVFSQCIYSVCIQANEVF